MEFSVDGIFHRWNFPGGILLGGICLLPVFVTVGGYCWLSGGGGFCSVIQKIRSNLDELNI